ncbi:MAG: RDD family protein [Chloroflexi bacterium]|nr:RDD family protein [Chloroflexota bacterium]
MIQLGRLEIETPDHVVLRYDLAGGGNRGFAALIDFVVATFLVIGMIALWAVLEAVLPRRLFLTTQGLFVLVTLVVAWSYFIVLEWLWEGRTLGKRMFGLRVISADGSPASFTAVLIRNLLRIVDFLPAFYGLGLLAIVLSSRSQRLGDLAAGTFVVRAPRPRIDLLSLRTVASADGPSVEVRGLPGELQRLVREFVARERGLSDADRRRVAASIASALRVRAPDLTGSDDVELIRMVARSLRATGDAAHTSGGSEGGAAPFRR